MDIVTKKYHREYTNYPEIFKGVYWGGFLGKPECNIIKNRNNFVKEFKIYRKSQAKKPRNVSMFDHKELYMSNHTDYDYVFVISPYWEGDTELLFGLGFVKYPSLYSNDAFTYIKTLTDLRELNALRRFFEKNKGIF